MWELFMNSGMWDWPDPQHHTQAKQGLEETSTEVKPGSPAGIQQQISLLGYIQAPKSRDPGTGRGLAVMGRDTTRLWHVGTGKTSSPGEFC